MWRLVAVGTLSLASCATSRPAVEGAAAVGSDRGPEPSREVEIAYPEKARRAGISGTVRLRIHVDEMGEVLQVRVLAGPGHGLDEAAAGALKRFKFRPGMKGGKPVAMVTVYNYKFILK